MRYVVILRDSIGMLADDVVVQHPGSPLQIR
jgi:hypothetical protein